MWDIIQNGNDRQHDCTADPLCGCDRLHPLLHHVPKRREDETDPIAESTDDRIDHPDI